MNGNRHHLLQRYTPRQVPRTRVVLHFARLNCLIDNNKTLTSNSEGLYLTALRKFTQQNQFLHTHGMQESYTCICNRNSTKCHSTSALSAGTHIRTRLERYYVIFASSRASYMTIEVQLSLASAWAGVGWRACSGRCDDARKSFYRRRSTGAPLQEEPRPSRCVTGTVACRILNLYGLCVARYPGATAAPHNGPGFYCLFVYGRVLTGKTSAKSLRCVFGDCKYCLGKF